MTLRLAAAVQRVATEGGVLLLDEQTGRFFSVNASGAFVLDAMLAGASTADAASRLADAYGIDAERARADVSAFVAHLSNSKLVAKT